MSAIHKFKNRDGGFCWDGVEIQHYSTEQAAKVTKQVLIGARDGAGNFEMRYFELVPQSRTSLDQHEHDHGVMVVRGRGKVRINEQQSEIEYGDVVYISANDLHQFANDSEEPFGFICIIPPKS
ncbi:MAG: cupin domain-containing protein [bacterium]